MAGVRLDKLQQQQVSLSARLIGLRWRQKMLERQEVTTEQALTAACELSRRDPSLARGGGAPRNSSLRKSSEQAAGNISMACLESRLAPRGARGTPPAPGGAAASRSPGGSPEASRGSAGAAKRGRDSAGQRGAGGGAGSSGGKAAAARAERGSRYSSNDSGGARAGAAEGSDASSNDGDSDDPNFAGRPWERSPEQTATTASGGEEAPSPPPSPGDAATSSTASPGHRARVDCAPAAASHGDARPPGLRRMLTSTMSTRAVVEASRGLDKRKLKKERSVAICVVVAALQSVRGKRRAVEAKTMTPLLQVVFRIRSELQLLGGTGRLEASKMHAMHGGDAAAVLMHTAADAELAARIAGLEARVAAMVRTLERKLGCEGECSDELPAPARDSSSTT